MIKGNLIVVPVQNSLIYLQPIYLQSANSAFPAFERIVVASPTKVVWATTLGGSLSLLLAQSGASPPPSASPSPAPSGGPTASPTPSASSGPGSSPPADDVAALIAYANQHFELAQEALRKGDFATYGAEIAKVQQALQRLDVLVPSSSSPQPLGSGWLACGRFVWRPAVPWPAPGCGRSRWPASWHGAGSSCSRCRCSSCPASSGWVRSSARPRSRPNGPTTGLVVRIALVAGLALAALVAGTVVAAASEISLVQAGAAGCRSIRHPPAAATIGLLGRVVLIRLLSLVPLAIALAIGLPRLGQITYLELTAPTDLVTPIALRVAAQAPEVVGLIGLAWLVGEAWAGLAVRLVVLRGERVAAAFIGSVVLCLRRPVSIVGSRARVPGPGVRRTGARDRPDQLVLGDRPERLAGRRRARPERAW